MLGGLWTVESNYARLATLAEETAWPLSHFRPEPELVEVDPDRRGAVHRVHVPRSQGPRAVRSLVALRRLPPAPPDTLIRAIATAC